MPLDSESFDGLSPGKLARLLDMDQVRWTREDASAALRQQLGSPLLPDLLMVPGAQRERLERLVAAGVPGESFATQLMGDAPALELLEAIKRWARQMREEPSSPLNGVPATVIYYAAIAAALARLGVRISKLTDEQLRGGFEWSRIQQGGEALRGTFNQALACVGG
jgi:hypothetical protein